MIPWESCVLWLGCPLQNGVWPDVSKHDNDGAITGAVWDGDSLEFDGIDDLVLVSAHSSLDLTQEITIETLLKPYGLGAGSYGRALAKTSCLFMFSISGNRAYMRIYDSGGTLHDTNTPTGSFVYDEWHHIVATYDGTVQKIYLNGVLCPDIEYWSGTIKSRPTYDTIVGNISDHSQPFDGKIAIMRLYNKAFTADQAREAYEQSYKLI